MLIYRLYFLKHNRLERSEDIAAEHDLAAIEMVRDLALDHSVELWSGKRKITTFDPQIVTARDAKTIWTSFVNHQEVNARQQALLLKDRAGERPKEHRKQVYASHECSGEPTS